MYIFQLYKRKILIQFERLSEYHDQFIGVFHVQTCSLLLKSFLSIHLKIDPEIMENCVRRRFVNRQLCFHDHS